MIEWINILNMSANKFISYMRPEWVPEFSEWMVECEDPHYYYCKACDRTNSLGNMGRSSLVCHTRQKRHIMNMKVFRGQAASGDEVSVIKRVVRKNFNTPNPVNTSRKRKLSSNHHGGLESPDGEDSVVSAPLETKSDADSPLSKIPKMVSQNNIDVPDTIKRLESDHDNGTTVANPLKAEEVFALDTESLARSEIYCAYYFVMNNLSFLPAQNLDATLNAMFLNHPCPEKFSMNCDKMKALLNFGIGPYIKSKLIDTVSKSPFFTVCCVETCHSALEKFQLDFYVKYWDSGSVKAIQRYWGSIFTKNRNPSHLVSLLSHQFKHLDTSRMIQLVMDGSEPNWDFYYSMQTNRENENMSKFLDLGNNTSFQLIHDHFQSFANSATSGIKVILKSAYKFFHKCPDMWLAREHYTSEIKGTQYPLPLEKTRWIDNATAVNRLLEIWNDISLLMKFYRDMPRDKQPSSKTFTRLMNSTRDVLMVPKLNFFSYIAGICQPYFSSKNKLDNVSSVSNFYKSLADLMRCLMKLIVKDRVLHDRKTVKDLVGVNLQDPNNFLKTATFNLGPNTEITLAKLRRQNIVTDRMVSDFKLRCKMFIISLLNEIPEVIPDSPISMKLSCFDPVTLTTANMKHLHLTFNQVLKYMADHGVVARDTCKETSAEYGQFIRNRSALSKALFNYVERGLGDLFFSQLRIEENYPRLAHVIKLILCLNPGRNLDKELFPLSSDDLESDMVEDTIINTKIVKDYLTNQKVELWKTEIPADLLESARSALSKYSDYIQNMQNIFE